MELCISAISTISFLGCVGYYPKFGFAQPATQVVFSLVGVVVVIVYRYDKLR